MWYKIRKALITYLTTNSEEPPAIFDDEHERQKWVAASAAKEQEPFDPRKWVEIHMDWDLYQREHREKHPGAFLLSEQQVAEAKQQVIMGFLQRIPAQQRQGLVQVWHEK